MQCIAEPEQSVNTNLIKEKTKLNPFMLFKTAQLSVCVCFQLVNSDGKKSTFFLFSFFYFNILFIKKKTLSIIK